MINILSIDGGGVRGLISARVIQNIENDLNIKVYDHFDVFAGTSVGSMINGALVYGKISGNDLIDKFLSEEHIRQIMPTNFNYIGLIVLTMFMIILLPIIGSNIHILYGSKSNASSSLIGGIIASYIAITIIILTGVPMIYSAPKYNGIGKSKIINDFIGDVLLTDTEKDFYLTSYCMTTHKAKFFKSWENTNILAKDAIDASSAAPGLFPAVIIDGMTYIDGSVISDNPTICVYSEIIDRYTKDGIKPKINILNIGCGTREVPKKPSDVKKWGHLQWILSGKLNLFVGNDQIESNHIEYITSALGDRYLRLDTVVGDIQPDNTSIANIVELIKIGDDIYKNNRESIKSFLENS